MAHNNQPVPASLKAIRLLLRTAGAISPKFAGYIVFQLFQTPLKRMPLKVDHTPRILTFTHKKRTLTGYEWQGSGKKVLLVHGWESSVSRFRALLRLLVEQDYHVFAMDAPAHGVSEGRQTNPMDYSEALFAFTQVIGKVDTIIAHSLGGAATMNLLHRNPSVKPEQIILIASVDHPRQAVTFFTQVFDLSPAVAEQMAQQMIKHFGSMDAVSSAYIAQSRTESALIFHDVQDQIVPVDAGRAISSAWEGAVYVETAGSGHRKILNNSEVLSQIMEFIGEKESIAVVA